MEPNNIEQEKQALMRRIPELAEDIYRALRPVVPAEWLTSDITVAQLRILLLLYTEGPLQMSSLASSAGIAVSTATGIVDNLFRKGLVQRQASPEDRRLVICSLSPAGQELVRRLWAVSRSQIEKLIRGLSLAQLRKVAEVVEILLQHVTSGETNAGKKTGDKA